LTWYPQFAYIFEYILLVLCMELPILPLLDGLLYPSESDEPVCFVSWPWLGRENITVQEFAALLNLENPDSVREEDPERFWSYVTTEHAWYGAEERERTARFVALQRVLEEHLIHIQYFEVGKIEVELYLVGPLEGTLVGIKTMAVRT
jgi:hypothetical protein